MRLKHPDDRATPNFLPLSGWMIAALVFLPSAGRASSGGTTYSLLATIGERLVSVDKLSGVATEIGPTTGYTITELAYDRHAQILYGIANAFLDPLLITIDPVTALVTPIGPVDLPGMDLDMIEALAFNPLDGLLYAAASEFGPFHDPSDYRSEKLVTVDPSTLVPGTPVLATFRANITGTLQNEADEFEFVNGVLYTHDGNGDDKHRMYWVDPQTAQGTLVGQTPKVDDAYGLSLDAAAGTLYAFRRDNRQLTIMDTATAQTVVVGQTHSASDFNGDLMESLVAIEVTVPPLRIAGLAPAAGPFSGGNIVTVLGAGFSPSTSIMFDDQVAAVMAYVSPTRLRVLVPRLNISRLPATFPPSFKVDVSAQEGGCRDTLPRGYTYR